MDSQIESLLQPNKQAVRILQRIGIGGSIFTSIVGIISLARWQVHSNPLFTMHPLVAIICITTGAALFFQIKNIPPITRSVWFFLSLTFSCITFFIGSFTLVQLVFTSAVYPNQALSLDTCLTIFLVGTALFFFQFPLIKYFTRIGQMCALAASVSTMFSVLGYVYQLFSLRQIVPFTPMLFSTAIVCTLICISLLVATASHGILKILTQNTTSSKLALRLIVITLTLPAISGYILLLVGKLFLLNTQTVISLFVVTTIILFSTIIWFNTRKLQKIELENLLIKNQLEKENITLKIDAEKLANKALELEEKKEQTYDFLMQENLSNPPTTTTPAFE